MSNTEISNSSRSFLSFFEEISKIPRGSGNTKKIADYLESFAKERSLDYIRDKADNVIIRKSATEGYEGRPCVIIQGHTDMVIQKEPGVTRDVEREGVGLVYDGDFIRADGTTLGADDGIAVAYALAILDSEEIPHPDIEAVFTSDEEIGLLGATALDTSNLRGRVMINIDSDDEDVFTVGCAGGRRVDIILPIVKECAVGEKYSLIIDGLKGGHSGIEIDKGRTNAIKRLADYLISIPDVRLISFDGGVADNAIPAFAVAEFSSSLGSGAISDIIDKIHLSLSEKTESENITLAKAGVAEATLTREATKNLLSLLSELPSGVIAMSSDIEGQVETSLNLGIIRLSEENAEITLSLRSAIGAQKEKLAKTITEIAKSRGANVSEHGDYPAWEYKKDSHIRDVMCKTYREMYGKDANVITIHAGLECGIFTDKTDGLDCVSAGPDAFDIHTPKERLSISSAVRFWEFLLEVLKNI